MRYNFNNQNFKNLNYISTQYIIVHVYRHRLSIKPLYCLFQDNYNHIKIYLMLVAR